MIKLMVVGSSPWPEDKYVPFEYAHAKPEDEEDARDGMIAVALVPEPKEPPDRKFGELLESLESNPN